MVFYKRIYIKNNKITFNGIFFYFRIGKYIFLVGEKKIFNAFNGLNLCDLMLKF